MGNTPLGANWCKTQRRNWRAMLTQLPGMITLLGTVMETVGFIELITMETGGLVFLSYHGNGFISLIELTLKWMDQNNSVTIT